MKCRRVEEVLPLLVEGDLGRRKSLRMAKHLEDCRSCRDLAAEYRESQSWLRTNSQKLDLDESVFDGLRRQVLSQIRQDNVATGVRGPRFIPAVAVGILIIVAGIALYFSQRDRQSDGSRSPELVQEQRETPAGTPQKVIRAAVPRSASKRVKPRRRVTPAVRVEREEVAITPTEQPLVSDVPEVSMSGSAEQVDPHTLRIEIQTSDPNIRIIWFARSPSKPESEDQ